MIEMFQYLTGVLENEEKRAWKILGVFSFISPVMDLFGFSMIILILNTVAREKHASDEMVFFTFLMGAILILKGFFEIYRCKIYNQFLYNGSQKLSMKMYEVLLKEDLLHHNAKSIEQVLALIRNDTEKCINAILTCLLTWINILTMTGYFIIMISISKWLGIVSSIAVVGIMIAMYFYYRYRMQDYGNRSRHYSIKANAQITIAYGTFKEISLIDHSESMMRRYKDASWRYAQTQREYKYHGSITSMLMQNSVMAVVFVILGFILWSPLENLIYILSLTMYITVLSKVIPLAYSVVSGMNSIEFTKKPYEIVRMCLEQYEQIKEKENKEKKIRLKEITLQKGISVRNLTFEYNEHTKIFLDASIDIPVGHSIAVIGMSGAGKTTFLDLIIGLLNPQSGNIFYDDYDIVSKTDAEGMCRANIGDIVSYIPQVVYLNGETVRNNVAFFEDEEIIDDEKVIESLKCAQVLEDVLRMPDGIHTLIGENGIAISGGQRQRIGLARALYKNFELLIMDEATAALDMETEKAVIDSIRHVKKNKTILMVTHHMSLANECDIVYKIEKQKFVRVK